MEKQVYMDEINIKFDPGHHRFTVQIDGHDCFVEYTESENGQLWNIVHTWVAAEIRNQGIAEKLMKAVATEARAINRKLTTSCSYAELFFKRHKEYADIVKN